MLENRILQSILKDCSFSFTQYCALNYYFLVVSQLYTHCFVNNKKALIFGEKWDIVGAKCLMNIIV